MLRIGLISPYNADNLGDMAIHQSVIAGMNDRISAEYVAICSDPERVSRAHGINAIRLSAQTAPNLLGRVFARLRFIRNARKQLTAMNSLIFAGGGQFDDFWGGPSGHPLTILTWVLLARLTRTPVAFVSIGVDSLSNTSAILLRWAVRFSYYVSFRDTGSQKIALSHGIGSPDSPVVPDLAYGLPLCQQKKADEQFGKPAKTIGLSPISIKSCPPELHRHHASYLEALIEFGLSALRNQFAIRILYSQRKMDRTDCDFIADELRRRLGDDALESISLREIQNLDDFLAESRRCDVIIASRLHGVLLAHVLNIPVIAIAYLRKVTQLMTDTGQNRYCLSMEDLTSNSLNIRFNQLMSKTEDEARKIKDFVDNNNIQLEQQFSLLASISRDLGKTKR